MSPPTFGTKRALLIFAAFWVVQLVVATAVGIYAGVHHGLGGAAAPGGGIPIAPGVVLGAAFAGTLLAGLLVVALVRRGPPEAPIAVGWAGASAGACARAALQGLALVATFILLSSVLPTPRQGLGPMSSLAQAGGWARVGWAVLAVAIAPPAEELVFRGVLYSGLLGRLGPPLAAAITTAVFVAFHVAEIGLYWPAWLAIGALGALALRARVATGSLLPAVALHASYNLGLVLAVYAASPRP